MHATMIKALTGVALLAGAIAASHAATARPFNLAPSADLHYVIKAQQKGIALAGDATVNWRAGEGKYSVTTVSNAAILGKILESRSEGVLDPFGIAPLQFTEKRFRKDATSAKFDRAARLISFGSGDKTYPLAGGEQDRSSAQWQLTALARAQPEKFTPGSEWRFFVAGRKDGDTWVFKVVKREKIRTALGEMEALHLSKAPPADAKGQQVDIWLAPKHEWYPVQIRFADEEGEFVEQTVSRIERK